MFYNEYRKREISDYFWYVKNTFKSWITCFTFISKYVHQHPPPPPNYLTFILIVLAQSLIRSSNLVSYLVKGVLGQSTTSPLASRICRLTFISHYGFFSINLGYWSFTKRNLFYFTKIKFTCKQCGVCN